MSKQTELAQVADTITVDSGNVGIGTSLTPSGSSASSRFITVAGSGDGVLQLTKTGSGGGAIASAAGTGMLFYTHTGTVGSESYSERMRLNSSGNLLVGKTSSSTNTVGIEIDGANGVGVFTRDGNAAIEVNRKTSDGTIINLRKDGSTVGSIGVGQSSDLYIGTSDTGILTSSSESITPWNPSTNVGRDAAIDLGTSDHRFKDLYLSGGVFLGGTGSANKLDDYEEGTFTPAFQNVSAPTYTNQTGSYTKIGRLVHVYISISYSSLDTTDGSSLAINLPFTATASGAFHLVESGTNTGYAGNNTISLIGSVGAGAAVINFGSTGDYNDGDYDSGNWNASGVLRFVGVYPAD